MSFASEGNLATITLVNSGAEKTLDLQVRGTPLTELDTLELTSQDADSVAEHGLYPYDYPAPWLSTISDVLSQHSFNLRLFGTPAERILLKWVADRDRDLATSLDFSQRVSVKRRGTDNDYFIENVEFRQRRPWLEQWLTLSPARFYGDVIILDRGPALNEVSLLAP